MDDTGNQPTRGFLRRASTWAFFGIPGLLAFFSTVSVQDAQSNIAGWLSFFGADRIPAALTSPGVDTIAQVTAVVLGALAAIYEVKSTAVRRKAHLEQMATLARAGASADELKAAAERLGKALDEVESIHVVRKPRIKPNGEQ